MRGGKEHPFLCPSPSQWLGLANLDRVQLVGISAPCCCPGCRLGLGVVSQESIWAVVKSTVLGSAGLGSHASSASYERSDLGQVALLP